MEKVLELFIHITKSLLAWFLNIVIGRITEASTLFGVVGFLLNGLTINSFTVLFFLMIVVPETWWDNTAKIKGEQLKMWIDDLKSRRK